MSVCKMGLLTAPTVKKIRISQIQDGVRTAAMLKTVKSPYLCNCLTDFDEIWHDDAYWPPTAERFRFFLKIQDGGSRHVENYKNRDISATV